MPIMQLLNISADLDRLRYLIWMPFLPVMIRISRDQEMKDRPSQEFLSNA